MEPRVKEEPEWGDEMPGMVMFDFEVKSELLAAADAELEKLYTDPKEASSPPLAQSALGNCFVKLERLDPRMVPHTCAPDTRVASRAQLTKCFVKLERLPIDEAPHKHVQRGRLWCTALAALYAEHDVNALVPKRVQTACPAKVGRLGNVDNGDLNLGSKAQGLIGLKPVGVHSQPVLKECRVRLERLPPLANSQSQAPTPRPFPSHSHLHITKGFNSFRCGSCGKKFKHKKSLMRHIETLKHERKAICKCRLSSKCTCVKTVKRHLCDMCGQRFSQRCHLARHKRMHSGNAYACDVCNKKFTRLNNLKEHRDAHAGVAKKYSCDVCDMLFTRQRNLMFHKRIHTGDKPYACDICKKVFSRPNNMKRHKRTHTGEALFSCVICDKEFTRLSNLKEHQWVHLARKQYRCEVCKKQFTRLSSLKKHEQKFHGKDKL